MRNSDLLFLVHWDGVSSTAVSTSASVVSARGMAPSASHPPSCVLLNAVFINLRFMKPFITESRVSGAERFRFEGRLGYEDTPARFGLKALSALG